MNSRSTWNAALLLSSVAKRDGSGKARTVVDTRRVNDPLHVARIDTEFGTIELRHMVRRPTRRACLTSNCPEVSHESSRLVSLRLIVLLIGGDAKCRGFDVLRAMLFVARE